MHTAQPIQGRVCLVIGSLCAGGAERQLALLATELHKRGVDVEVLAMSADGPLQDVLRTAGVPLAQITEWRTSRRYLKPVQWLIAGARLWVLLRRRRPKVLHAWLFHAYVVALPIAWLARVPVRISGRRGLRSSLRDSSLVELATNFAALYTSWYTANSKAVARDIVSTEGVSEFRISIIGNGIAVPVETASQVDQQPPIGVVIANLIHYKGHSTLIEAMKRTSTDFRVRFVGQGPMEDVLRDQVQAAGLSHRVEFLGFHPDPMTVLLEGQFAVLPSLSEGLPNAVMEAMAAGLPVIATDVGGVRELLDEGGGVIVPPADPTALAMALDRVASDPSFRVMAGTHNRARIAERSWPSVTERYIALYSQLIAEASDGH